LWRPYRYVEVDHPPDWLVLAGLLSRLQGAGVLLYMFENMPETAVLEYGLSRDHPLVRALVTIPRICASLAHRLIAPHELGRCILVRQGIAPRKIAAVVPNVPDPRIFLSRVAGSTTQVATGTPPSCEADPGAGDGRFRLVTHGTQTLLDAMAHLGERIPRRGEECGGPGKGDDGPVSEPSSACQLAAMGHSAYCEKVSWDRTKRDYLAVYGVHPTQIC
jgi:hypothetical protein